MKVARTVLNGESGGNAADLHNSKLNEYVTSTDSRDVLFLDR